MTASSLQAGVSAVNITPPVGCFLQGYSRGRPTIGIHRDLYAKALVLNDGTGPIGIVTLDLLGLDRTTVTVMHKAIASTVGIPANRIVLACSHTHAGPHVQGNNNNDPAYVDLLVHAVTQGLAVASQVMRPARMGYAESIANFAINRYLPKNGQKKFRPNPCGPVDHRVRVVSILDGAKPPPTDRPAPPPRAVFFVYSCHPTIMAQENLEISPDFPGIAQAFVEQAYRGGPTSGTGLPDGPGTLALFAQGCCGDLQPNLTTADGNGFRAGTKADVHRLGRQLGAAVVKATESSSSRTASVEIAAETASLTLPFTRTPTGQQIQEAITTGDNPGHLTASDQPVLSPDWASHSFTHQTQKSLPKTGPVDIQTIRLGKTHLIGLPGEAMCELGWQLEANSPETTLVISQANGDIGCLYPLREHSDNSHNPASTDKRYPLSNAKQSPLKATTHGLHVSQPDVVPMHNHSRTKELML